MEKLETSGTYNKDHKGTRETLSVDSLAKQLKTISVVGIGLIIVFMIGAYLKDPHLFSTATVIVGFIMGTILIILGASLGFRILQKLRKSEKSLDASGQLEDDQQMPSKKQGNFLVAGIASMMLGIMLICTSPVLAHLFIAYNTKG